MLLCNKLISCWDFTKRPCLRPSNHEGGCNPFSASPVNTVNITEKNKTVNGIETDKPLVQVSNKYKQANYHESL